MRIIKWWYGLQKRETELKVTGVVGRVVRVNEQGWLLIQTGDGLLWVIDFQLFNYGGETMPSKIVVGSRLGYYEQHEIYKLRNELKALKNKIDELTGDK